jgi:hypothetical protein
MPYSLDVPLLPGDPTEAGPDTRLPGDYQPPTMFDDFCWALRDAAMDALNLRRDDPAAQRKLQMEALDRAETFLAAAKAALA